MKLSVVIPTRNEAKVIWERIKQLKALNPYEIIICDFSKDETRKIAEKAFREFGMKGRVIKVKKIGKGIAVKEGLKKVKGDLVLITDADLSYPIEKIPKFIKTKGWDILIPKRKREDKSWRKLAGFIFKLIVRFMFNLKADTQCGLKLVKRKVVESVEFKSEGWAWDIEFVWKAKLKGFRISSCFIVEYKQRRKGKSKVSFLTPFQMLIEILKIRFLNFR